MASDPSTDSYFTPRQIAEKFLGDGRRERTVRHFYESHGLPVVRVGSSVLIRVGDFKDWLAARRREGLRTVPGTVDGVVEFAADAGRSRGGR